LSYIYLSEPKIFVRLKAKAYSLFGLLAIFSLIVIAPPAFADHTTAEVDMAVGSSVVGCETTNECYVPHMVTIDVGGEVMWNNIDGFAHTVSAGTPAEGLSDDFDSGLVAPGAMFSHEFTEAGTYDYFCMVHPWMQGMVMVTDEEMAQDEEMVHGDMKEMGHSDDHAAKGVEDISDQFTASVTSGVIHHIGANSDDDTLIVHLFGADDDGELKITLNEDIITPFDDGSYFVLINSEEVEFEQMGRTLHIDYDAGTEKIEIVGSHVVPEFGTIAMIVLAVAIVSIIAITAKTKTSLIPKL